MVGRPLEVAAAGQRRRGCGRRRAPRSASKVLRPRRTCDVAVLGGEGQRRVDLDVADGAHHRQEARRTRSPATRSGAIPSRSSHLARHALGPLVAQGGVEAGTAVAALDAEVAREPDGDGPAGVELHADELDRVRQARPSRRRRRAASEPRASTQSDVVAGVDRLGGADRGQADAWSGAPTRSARRPRRRPGAPARGDASQPSPQRAPMRRRPDSRPRRARRRRRRR